MMNRAGESPRSLWSKISCQRRDCFIIVTGIIRKFNSDRFRGSLRYGAVQFLYGTLRFQTLVEPDESYAFRKAYMKKQ